jgi:hypothetical protein
LSVQGVHCLFPDGLHPTSSRCVLGQVWQSAHRLLALSAYLPAPHVVHVSRPAPVTMSPELHGVHRLFSVVVQGVFRSRRAVEHTAQSWHVV